MNSGLVFAIAGTLLFALGTAGVLLVRPLFRRILAFNIMGSGAFLVLVGLAQRTGQPDPVTQAMVLTGIVVSVCATGLALALAEGLERGDYGQGPPPYGGGKIIVRRARTGEKLKTLDGVEHELHPDDLVIADAVKPVALAGVMGGFDTMITERTKNVLIESAWFDPATIRSTAKRLGMHTDASHRFERGVDPDALIHALERAAQLMAAVAEGADVAIGSRRVAGGRIVGYPLAGYVAMAANLGTLLVTDVYSRLRLPLVALLIPLAALAVVLARRLQLGDPGGELRHALAQFPFPVMAARVLAVRASQKGLELVFHVAPDVPETLIGDPGRLRQVISNLVVNAIRYNRPGGEVVVPQAISLLNVT